MAWGTGAQGRRYKTVRVVLAAPPPQRLDQVKPAPLLRRHVQAQPQNTKRRQRVERLVDQRKHDLHAVAVDEGLDAGHDAPLELDRVRHFRDVGGDLGVAHVAQGALRVLLRGRCGFLRCSGWLRLRRRDVHAVRHAEHACCRVHRRRHLLVEAEERV